jgi:RNA polymerase sigma-70 factor (ECF subfamily)
VVDEPGKHDSRLYDGGGLDVQVSPVDPRTPARAAWTDAAELVRRIHFGDRSAEDEFIQRYRRGVAVIVARASRDQLPVEDLCQDVLTMALQKVRAGAVRDPDRLSGFVAGLARMLVIEHFRKQSSRAAIEAKGPRPSGEVAPTVVDHLLQQERATMVRAVLAELESDRDREILFRFYIAEEDKETICRDLSLTPLHFNRVLFRARKRYRDLYRQWTAARGMTPTAG